MAKSAQHCYRHLKFILVSCLFNNLWNINDGVELTKPGDWIGRVLGNFRPVILGSNKVVVDSHEPDSIDLETIT